MNWSLLCELRAKSPFGRHTMPLAYRNQRIRAFDACSPVLRCDTPRDVAHVGDVPGRGLDHSFSDFHLRDPRLKLPKSSRHRGNGAIGTHPHR